MLKNLLKKCLNEAKKAEGRVSPNPLVAAIVLDKEGNFVSIGRHHRFGQAHAEVNALEKAAEKAKGGTLIITLEPCCHVGKTPACTDLIIKSGIKKVIAGTKDPNPLVSGKGFSKLQKAGIEVISGVLEEDCKKLNEIFFKNQTEKKPFIAIKTAVTLDGKTATASGSSKWITSQKSREYVQKLRNRYDAVLTGSGTILADNPSLTCRMKNGRNPARVVVDTNANTPPESKVYDDNSTPVYVAVSEKLDDKKLSAFAKHIKFIKCPVNESGIDLEFLTLKLFESGIMSILVEAGGKLNGSFFKQKLTDKVYQFTAPKILGDAQAHSWIQGLSPDRIDDCMNLRIHAVKKLSCDVLIESYTL